MEWFSLLLILSVLCGVSIANNDSDACPLWHYLVNNTCKFGKSVYGAVKCIDGVIYLRVDYGMDVFEHGTITVVAQSKYAYHNYSSIPSSLRVYVPFPNGTRPEDLNEFMCNRSNRKSFMCGKCLPKYGPSPYSFKCHKCYLSLSSAIALYLTIKLLPIAILFSLIVTFRINITKGPLLGYIIFCQLHVIMARELENIYQTVIHQMKAHKILLRIPYFISAIWNLDFLQVSGLVRPFCISDKLWDYDVLTLNFISVLFPLFLVIITYILIELHARDFKVVVFCWKPFHCCFVKVRRNWSASDSIIHAFASLLLLSFATLNYNSYQILNSINIYTVNESHAFKKNREYNHPGIETYTPDFIYYTIIVLVLLFFLGVLPSLLLLLYPIRIFRVRLQTCCSQRVVLRLNTFVETFHGTFKDGCNGTRDFRTIPGLVACIIILGITVSVVGHAALIVNYIDMIFVIFLILLSILCAYARPCKAFSANLSLSFHLMWLAALGGLVTLWKQDFTMDTNVLASVFVITVPIPHILMFLWLCYRLEKKFHLRERSVVCFNRVMGQTKFGKRLVGVQTPLLPDRLLNSGQYYRELASSS